MSGRGRDPVKVKIIMTQFVQTDAQSFKSVVQGLTGRDSAAASTTARQPTPLPSPLEESFSNGEKKVMMTREAPFAEAYHQLQDMDMFLELPAGFDEFFSFCSD